MNDAPPQGPVDSLKAFAARRASSEDRQRLSRDLSEILRVDKLDELQRRTREVVSTKVQSALERLKEQQAPDTKLLEPEREGEGGGNSGVNGAYATTSVKAAAAGGGGGSNSTDEAQRAAKEALLLRQKTLGMEMRQRARLGKMEIAHRAQMERLTRTQED